MERGLVLLNQLHRIRKEYYRYITYDEGAAGSNQKIYSWDLHLWETVSMYE